MGCSANKPLVQHWNRSSRFQDEYAIGARLGNGSYGEIWIAKSKTTVGVNTHSEEHAVKIMRYLDKNELTNHRREALLLGKVSMSAHCVKLITTFTEKDAFMIVMEKCSGDLMARISKNQILRRCYPKLVMEMLLGLEYVHNEGIVHRDIKAENYVFGGAAGDTLKLTDFGFSTIMPSKGGCTGCMGTASYMSPEMVIGFEYDQKTDVWSLGATAHLMMLAAYPYMPVVMNSLNMKTAIRMDLPKLRLVGECSQTEFLRFLLQRQPRLRCTVKQALEHEYLMTAFADMRVQGTSRMAQFPPAPTASRPTQNTWTGILPAPPSVVLGGACRDIRQCEPSSMGQVSSADRDLWPLSHSENVEECSSMGHKKTFSEDDSAQVSTCDALPNVVVDSRLVCSTVSASITSDT